LSNQIERKKNNKAVRRWRKLSDEI